MLPRERVLEALNHREPDRVPLYLWVFKQPGVTQAIEAKYGSMEAFYDALSLDLCQTFPRKGLLKEAPARSIVAEESDAVEQNVYGDLLGKTRKSCYDNVLTLDEALEVEFTDPDDEGVYTEIRYEVEHHKGRKGRAIFVQTPGVFEAANGIIGLEQNLMEMALRPELVTRLYERIARWNHRYIEHVVEIGVDVIHVSDDWGMNDALLFSPEMWWELVYPAERITTEFAQRLGVPLSLHSDGNIKDVLDGVVTLGFRCFHPVQESAGMRQADVKRRYGHALTLYCGLDVCTTLGRGEPAKVRDEVRRVMRELKPGGGFIFCTSHMVQPGTPLEEVEMAYQVALEESRY